MRTQKNFDTFDRTWEFVNFLQKLMRTTGATPKVIVEGMSVIIEDPKNSKALKDGIKSYFTDKDSTIDVDHTTPTGHISVYCDGGSRGNPGPSATGYVIYDSDDNLIAEGGEFLGVTTNNQAEYHSLKDSLERALAIGATELRMHMDSQLVVKQIEGHYKVKNRDLWPLYESTKKLISNFDSFSIVHVPREINKEADAMVNKILDDNTKTI